MREKDDRSEKQRAAVAALKEIYVAIQEIKVRIGEVWQMFEDLAISDAEEKEDAGNEPEESKSVSQTDDESKPGKSSR